MLEEAKGDFAAYSHGTMIDPTLYNIRRERRNELCAEAFRWDDLKRWRALDQFKTTPYRTEGMRYWGSVYEEQLKDLCIVNPSTGNMSSLNQVCIYFHTKKYWKIIPLQNKRDSSLLLPII